MKILFDQGTPVPLRGALGGHEVVTAYERGWGKMKNGDLLREAEAGGFEVFTTTDQNLGYQQNLKERRLAILVPYSTITASRASGIPTEDQWTASNPCPAR